MAETSPYHSGKLRRKVRRRRRRRQRSWFSQLKRQLQPGWIQIRTILRSPLYQVTSLAASLLMLLFWLLGVVTPSSEPMRYPANPGESRR